MRFTIQLTNYRKYGGQRNTFKDTITSKIQNFGTGTNDPDFLANKKTRKTTDGKEVTNYVRLRGLSPSWITALWWQRGLSNSVKL